ncbi:T9SS type A sorting domain-containing protein [Labilibaculum sp. K2S]|uniref:T9SS type A sorting domain-containing protein n=1 Tax=Labilibaculum sp. K2S TaxID=3056386 RepID=UPI0025A45FEE|nr:T9SS type A sorting domain-containing protein [Labilibaculum sp. K2S]MDM8161836.1 T9SS type A sorting domain-containing protein [Labilibaculum sp. K2S]
MRIFIIAFFLILKLCCAYSLGACLPLSDDSKTDTTAPEIIRFECKERTYKDSVSLFIDVRDNFGIGGFILKTYDEKPDLEDKEWGDFKPSHFYFDQYGTFNLFLWVKDTSGNISESKMCRVTYYPYDDERPLITEFSCQETVYDSKLSFDIRASDNIGVVGYFLAAKSDISNKWTSIKPEVLLLPDPGFYTCSLWVKDYAGNVSYPKVANVEYIQDTIAPQIIRFECPKNTTTETIQVNVSAEDDFEIKKYYLGLLQDSIVITEEWTEHAPYIVKLPSYGDYSIEVKAVDCAGNISKIAMANVNYSDIVLSENSLTNCETKIYPNPTKGKIIIDTDRNQNYSVFNSSGILVKNGRIERGSTEISLIGMSSGVYSFKLNSNNNIVVRKIIKND